MYKIVVAGGGFGGRVRDGGVRVGQDRARVGLYSGSQLDVLLVEPGGSEGGRAEFRNGSVSV